jgi:uncharacterized protein
MAEGETFTNMKIACIDCSSTDACCCRGVEIYLTAGDVSRITGYLHNSQESFCSFVTPTGIYADGGGDPAWVPLVVRPDGTRRIVKSLEDGSCVFLTPTGCSLPLNVRPLLCRIHPYDFDHEGLRSIDPTCPIATMSNGHEALKLLGMPLHDVTAWHRTLYTEILQERGLDRPGVNDSRASL